MKTCNLLAGLVCLALIQIAAIAYVKKSGGSPGVTRLATAIVTSPAAPEKPEPTTMSGSPAMPASFSWRQIESEDYHQYIANLRSIGCPEQTLRDIVISDVNKLYAARETTLKIKPPPAQGQPEETPEQKFERLRQLRTIQEEKRWVVKELLGIDLPLDMLPSTGSRDYHAFEVAFRHLPEDKRDMVQFLQEAYWQQSDVLKANHDNKRSHDFQVEHYQLKSALRQELAGVLTPVELEDYDMRTSATAKELSDRLATYFNPTEDEFRQIFRAARDHEEALERLAFQAAQDVLNGNTPDKQALAKARSSALNQLNEQIRTALGEDRHAQLERSQDRTYDLLARLGMRYGLPQETVFEAYELQKSFQSGQGPSSAAAIDRAEMQKRLNEELTAILGEQAVRGYQRVHGGQVPLQ
jgi:hypothetical protein